MANYTGRTTIFIPEQSSEINKGNIVDIMQRIMPTILSNFSDWNELWDYYTGVQPILNKTRESEEDDSKNNKVLENHAEYLVNFKSSYLIADGFKYSQTSDQRTNDVTQLNRYYVDEGKVAKDLDLAENIYIGGTGYKLTSPKTEKIDPKGESPFNIIILDNNKTFVAYTTQPGHKTALSGYVTKEAIGEGANQQIYYQFTIYTDTKIFTFKTTTDIALLNDSKVEETEHSMGRNPIVEYPLNKARIGVIDVAYSVLNAANIVSSNQLDDIVDFVNSILVFYNVDIDTEKVKETRAVSALEVKDKNPQMPAKVEYVANQLNHDGVNNLYDRLIKTVYGIVGVPIPSGQVTSGGDTGEARKLGGGYESADQIIKREETAFINAERETLKLELKICKTIKETGIEELYAADIQIHPTRHNLDNILTKVQAFTMLVGAGCPVESALILTGLGANPHELAGLWNDKKTDVKDGEQPIDINNPDNPGDSLNREEKEGDDSSAEEK